MQIQWYPGHMTKARRSMEEDIKLVDLIIEILDARIPFSSRNPDLDEIAKGKMRIVLLNKADMADDSISEEWVLYFKEKGIKALLLDARSIKDVNALKDVIKASMAEKIERDKKKGYINTTVRAMVAGIPNAGKSTFINTFAKKAIAKTGNKPGVTKGKQWIKIDKELELLDTPGILWPKFDNEKVGINLAITGAIKDDILEKTELSCHLISYLYKNYKDNLGKRYDQDTGIIKKSLEEGNNEVASSFLYLEKIAISRNCIKKGGETDTDKAALLVLDDLRSGKLGRITLECPEDMDV